MSANGTNRTGGWKTLALSAAVAAAMSAAPAIAATTAISYWKFDEHNTTPGNHTAAADFMVIDSTGNANHLYSYEGDANGYDYTESASTPPQFNGSNVASVTPDPSNGGVLFHEVLNSGNDFNLSGKSFTLEGSFRTSASGRQEIIFNSQNLFSYLVNVNEGGAGVLRFAVGGGPFPQVNLSNAGGGGYANGQWYSFVATYQENGAGQQDLLTLSTYGVSGALLETGTALTPAGYNPVATTNNLGVGNTIFNFAFQGQLDETRISRGLVADKWQLHSIDHVAVDTFDNTHDYKASGVAGTIWDGIVNGAGAATTFATTNSPTTLGDGNLAISYSAAATVGFDADRANAPFLFRTVQAGRDFDAQLVIESSTHANYSVVGLMVRDALDGLTGGAANANEDWVSLNYNNFGGNADSIRFSDDGAVINPFGGAFERFLRIVREGDLFSFYTRALDTDDWALRFAADRPDLAGDVQVGLWYGLFSGGNAGTAQIENFILYVAIPAPAALPAGLALLWLASLRRRARL